MGESVLKAFSNPTLGDVAVAYLLYKIATPARYTVTIAGTHWTVKQLRRLGYMRPVPTGDSIRNLMKDGREQMKDKVGDLKEDMKGKAGSMKDRADDVKGKLKDRADDVKGKLKEKTKDRVDSMKKKVHKK